MTRFLAMCAFAILTMLMAGHAFAKGAAERSLVMMDGRFSGFDAIAHIRNNHPEWDGAAEAVSHWSAYYNVNPILLLHVLKATASPGMSTKTIRKTVFVAFYTYDDFGLANFYAGNVDFDRWRSDEAMVIDMLQTAGGDFTNLSPIDAGDPDAVNEAGYVSLKFLDCNKAVADVSLDERSSGQPVEHSVELVKLIGVPDHVCEAVSLPLENESGSTNSQ